MQADTIIHLRRVDGQTRTHRDAETGLPREQVKALCGQWVSYERSARDDRRLVDLNTCDECQAQHSLTVMYG